MMKRLKELDKTELLLGAALLFEVLLLCYYNLFHIRDVLDQDFAKILRHVIEMGRNHTLFLKNWEYLTTGEMDAASLPAWLFYQLTHNIYLCYSLAGILNTALWCYVVVRFLLNIGISRKYILLALCFLFTAYDFGMLAYTNMMFFAGGQYVYKVLVPILLIMLLFLIEKPYRKSDWIIVILYSILLFFVCAASKMYVILCALIPIWAVVLLFVLLKVKQERHKQWFIAFLVTVGVSVLGLAVSHLCGITAKSYALKPLDWVIADLFLTFRELLRVFNPLGAEETAVFSAAGITGLLRLALAGIILVFGFLSLKDVFGISVYRDVLSEKTTDDRRLIQTALISVFVWNYFIQFLTLSSARYHLIGVIPLILCSVMNLDSVLEKDKVTPLPTILLWVLSGALVVVNGYQLIHSRRHYFREDEETLASMQYLVNSMNEKDIGTAFLLDDGSVAERLRAVDIEHVYENYNPEDGSVVNYDFYITDRDRSAFTERNVIIGPEFLFETCPDFIQSSYTRIDTIGDFGIWISERNPIDGISGLPAGDYSVDLPTAPGYQVQGEIQPDGSLYTADSGTILSSPELIIQSGTAEMKLLFESDGEAMLNLYQGEELVQSLPLSGNELSITVSSGMRYEILNQENSSLIINRAEFSSLKNS